MRADRGQLGPTPILPQVIVVAAVVMVFVLDSVISTIETPSVNPVLPIGISFASIAGGLVVSELVQSTLYDRIGLGDPG